MKNIIFIAPPAAGKGTQSVKIKDAYHLAHISTGDLLRAAAKENTPDGLYIRNQMETGGLVSDEITEKLLKQRLAQSDCNNGYILDGFPRNPDQAADYAKMLDELHKEVGVVIYLSLDKETARKRVVGRETCPNCGAMYNTMIDGMKPKVEGMCDKCFGILSKRADDCDEIFEHRYDTYLKDTEPLLAYYDALGVLETVDSSQSADKVFSDIQKILDRRNK
jgi:adenylate kinase